MLSDQMVGYWITLVYIAGGGGALDCKLTGTQGFKTQLSYSLALKLWVLECD